jgi:putative two-component system response regulator
MIDNTRHELGTTQAFMENQYKILVVESKNYIVDIVQNAIKNHFGNVEVYAAPNLTEAHYRLQEIDFDIMLISFELANGSSTEFIRRVKKQKNTLPIVVFISKEGCTDSETKLKLLDAGTTLFIETPFTTQEIISVISNLVALNEAHRGLEHADNIMRALMRAIEARDPYTIGHAERVGEYSLAIFDAVGLKGEQRQDLYAGCLLHDVGKIGLGDDILKSSESLTEEQYDRVKQHPIAGARITESIHRLKGATPVILQHHEKLNGGGYPYGVEESDIHILAQICAIADIYDSLTTNRSYRSAMNTEDALRITEEEVQRGELNRFFFNTFKGEILDVKENS